MIFSTLRHKILALLLSCGLAFGCVSKGKYYDALQDEAAAKSELGISTIDLADARAQLLRQEALEEGLRSTIKQLDGTVEELTNQSRNDQKQIGASLNKSAVEVERYKQQLDITNRKLGVLKSFIDTRTNRLAEVSQRLNVAVASIPNRQVSTTQNYDVVTIRFDEGLFFQGKGDKLSDFGIGLLQKLTGALSDQTDLLVEVVAYPTVPAGTLKSWASASDRANFLASELAGEFGLSPKQVSASSRQGEVIIIDGAPAESKQRKTVELVIRLDPTRYPVPLVD
jgi:hypothetical protein